jgi:hypothetical protein
MEKEKNVSLDKKEIIKEFFLITGMYVVSLSLWRS